MYRLYVNCNNNKKKMNSIWFENIELPSFPELKKDIKTDVLIIGGGIAGILTAYLLHERNVPYVLVEKDRICGGTTVYGCEIGSEITINTGNGEEIFKVKGFVEDPFLGSMPIGIKQFFISDSDFERLYAENTDNENAAFSLLFPCRIIHIFQAESSDISVTELKKELNRECQLVDRALFTQSRESSDEITTIFTETGTKMLCVYGHL